MKKSILSFFVAAGLVGSASATALTGDLTNGLVAYYSFNGNANDSVGGNNAIISGSQLTSDRFGKANSSLSINAVNGGAISESSFIIDGNQSRTISFWCKFSSNGSPYTQVGVGWGKTWGFTGLNGQDSSFSQESTGNVYFSGSWADIYAQNTSSPNYDIWRMLTFSYDSSLGLNYSSIYINGVIQTPDSRNGHLNFLNTASTPLSIFGLPGDYIDDVGIWNRALTSLEVSQLYSAQVIPEPSTYALFGIGAIGMLMVMRRKRTA